MVAELIGISGFLTTPVTCTMELTFNPPVYLTICLEIGSLAAITACTFCPCCRSIKNANLALCTRALSTRATSVTSFSRCSSESSENFVDGITSSVSGIGPYRCLAVSSVWVAAFWACSCAARWAAFSALALSFAAFFAALLLGPFSPSAPSAPSGAAGVSSGLGRVGNSESAMAAVFVEGVNGWEGKGRIMSSTHSCLRESLQRVTPLHTLSPKRGCTRDICLRQQTVKHSRASSMNPRNSWCFNR